MLVRRTPGVRAHRNFGRSLAPAIDHILQCSGSVRRHRCSALEEQISTNGCDPTAIARSTDTSTLGSLLLVQELLVLLGVIARGARRNRAGSFGVIARGSVDNVRRRRGASDGPPCWPLRRLGPGRWHRCVDRSVGAGRPAWCRAWVRSRRRAHRKRPRRADSHGRLRRRVRSDRVEGSG